MGGDRLLAGFAAAALLAATLSGCGSGDSTVAKTPQATAHPTSRRTRRPRPRSQARRRPARRRSTRARSTSPPPRSPEGFPSCPAIPRSQQPWNPEPLAGNYNECAQLSAVIVKANTNAESPNTRAVMFHLGKFIPPRGVPDTYGFNGIDPSQCTGDTVALMYSGGIGLPSVVKFRWNGNGVELVANAGR